ncbi:MAG: M48 family metalloprotease [Thermodesulfobacteriota bacterium]
MDKPVLSRMPPLSLPKRLVAFFLAAWLLLLPARPSWAFFGSLTLDKERQVGEEFFLELQQYYPIIGDPFLNSYLNHVGQRLVAQLGPQPFNYRFFILVDPTINAFAVPGGYVFITSGMIGIMERESELAGVLAHEISHIYARHMARQMDKAKFVNIASLIGGLAAVFLGGGALAEPLLMGSAALSTTAMLKYSRDFEREADSLGFKWMTKAGYNPRDMILVFKKMGRQRWFEGGKIPIYLSTHPDIDSRMVDLGHQLSAHQGQIAEKENDPDFQYFTIKLMAISGNAHQLLRRMTQDSLREPKNPAFHYGRALALDKLERPDEAMAAFQQALSLSPGNYLIQRDLAIHYFNRNRYPEALKILETLSPSHPRDEAILYYLGRIYQERRQADKALPLFEKIHFLNPAFIEVYYNLGTLYGEKGKIGLSHYYLGFYSLRAKALSTALFHFRKALPNLSPGDNRYAEVKRQIARLEKMRVKVPN